MTPFSGKVDALSTNSVLPVMIELCIPKRLSAIKFWTFNVSDVSLMAINLVTLLYLHFETKEGDERDGWMTPFLSDQMYVT